VPRNDWDHASRDIIFRSLLLRTAALRSRPPGRARNRERPCCWGDSRERRRRTPAPF